MALDPSIPLSARTFSLGSAFSEAFGQGAQMRLHQESARGLREQREGLAEQRRIAADQARRDAERAARLGELFTTNPNPSRADIMKADPSENGSKIATAIDALQDVELKRYKDHWDVTKHAVSGILALPESMRAAGYTTTRQAFIQRGWATPEQLPEQYDPTFVEGIEQQLLSPDKLYELRHPKLTERDPTKDLVDPQGNVVKPGTPAVKTETRGLDVQAAEALAKGDTATYQRLLKVKKEMGQADDRPTASITIANQSASDVKEAIAGMKDGTIPPQMPGRASKDYTAIMAEAHRQGFDLKSADLDFAATQKHFATLNGAQQTRIRQAVDTAYHSLDVIDELADKWKGGRFPVLNSVTLKAAKGGLYGKDAASIANQLDAQIGDVTSELANVYMGGNSPTDHALTLAAKNLSANWSQEVLKDMTKMARTNLQIRSNAIKNTAAITPSNVGASMSAGGGKVKMQAPNGGPVQEVDPSEVEHYKKLGAKVIGGGL